MRFREHRASLQVQLQRAAGNGSKTGQQAGRCTRGRGGDVAHGNFLGGLMRESDSAI
jgi:hypothetical protein